MTITLYIIVLILWEVLYFVNMSTLSDGIETRFLKLSEELMLLQYSTQIFNIFEKKKNLLEDC